jgi:hypothetical protein
VFSFYGWGGTFVGLVSAEGEPRGGYYALRLAIRALQGGRPTFRTTASATDLVTITTRDPDGTVNLLVVNSSATADYRVRADLSGLLADGKGTIRQFSTQHKDEVVGQSDLANGLSTFEVPPAAAVLVQYVPAAEATAEPPSQ